MNRRAIQVLGAIGIGCAIVGGWFALNHDYLIAAPLWLIAGVVIMVQKRKRKR